MNFEYLNEFVVFSQHLNVSHAAKKLFVSQSRLSQHLAAMEAELGFDLTDRHGGKRGRLTPEGTMFRDFAQHVLAEYEAMLGKCLEKETDASFTLHISKPALAIVGTLNRAIQRYQQTHPDASVSIVLDNQIGFSPLDIVDQHMSDAATVFLFPEKKAQIEADYDLIHLRNERPHLVFGRTSPFADRQSVSVRDLNDVDLTFAGDVMHMEFYNKYVIEAMEAQGVYPRFLALTVNDYDEFLLMDEEAVAIMMESYARKFASITEGHFRHLPLDDVDFSIEMYLLYRPEHLDERQLEYLSLLAEEARRDNSDTGA